MWDIGLIINRALVYGLLTGFLALVYFASVLVLQAVIQVLMRRTIRAGRGRIHARDRLLFQPLRGCIQEFIDRRFYRRRYNAEQTLAAFAAEARDEVEVERLAQSLIGAVRSTSHPEPISLWLAPPELPRPSS